MKEIFDMMVALNFDNRNSLHPSNINSMHPAEFAKEFKTIHMNMGRQTGKTSLMLDLARPTDLIIVPTMAMVDSLYHRSGTCRAQIVTFSSVFRRRFHNVGYAWVDEPSLYGKDFNFLYSHIDAELFIKLGE